MPKKLLAIPAVAAALVVGLAVPANAAAAPAAKHEASVNVQVQQGHSLDLAFRVANRGGYTAAVTVSYERWNAATGKWDLVEHGSPWMPGLDGQWNHHFSDRNVREVKAQFWYLGLLGWYKLGEPKGLPSIGRTGYCFSGTTWSAKVDFCHL